MLGAGPSAPISFSLTWNLVEFLEILNLGLNVNPKDQGCEVRTLEMNYVLGPGAKLLNASCLSVAESM